MIKIRAHLKKDIPFRVKWLNNKKATIFALDNPNQKTTIAEQEEWFRNYKNNSNKKFFTILFNDKPIGFMGLSDIDFNSKKASVFILIGEDNYREKGVGTVAMNFLIKKAFNDLKLKKLVLEVNKFNVSAITLYKKIGFKIINKNDKEFCMTLMRSSYA